MKSIPIIDIRDLTVVYNAGTINEVVALTDFSLKVEKGEILVITGGNGSGKSTVLGAISGTVPIKSGSIKIDGIDITKWSPNKRAKLIGMVYQDTMLGTCPNLTIHENFQICKINKWWAPIPYNLKLSKKQIESLIHTGLSLESRDVSKINMLSGGQRQAIAVCLAFENSKPVLLFDEFTSSLDKDTREKVLDFVLEKAKSENATMLMVIHNISMFTKFYSRIIKL